ncbi:hypothetical protein BGX34_005385 [Mortierella sp. NVP85]|nr:hypothetical protein BGX34_005385 [Mortierella sp. NVP85]
MASTSTRIAQEPRSSIFDVPELVELVAQYLSGHDIIQCMATSKAWERLFEPFVWQDVVLKGTILTPQAMACNRHRIRSLQVAHNDYTNLGTLADGLPSVTPFSPDNLDLTSSPLKSCGSTVSSLATGSNIFQSLSTIHVGHKSHTRKLDEKDRLICLDYIFRIINQSPGLHWVTLGGEILDQSDTQVQSLLYLLGHKLPCLKRLDVTYAQIDLDIGLELVRVCFNHPQLADLDCRLSVRRAGYYRSKNSQRLNAFLTALENDHKTREASGELAVGTRIKSLKLPKFEDGYPSNFICALLRSHLPNLEQFDVPEIYDNEDTSYSDSLKKAVAQGCPRLQHIRVSWNNYTFERTIHQAMDGIIQGCNEMGLKSLHWDGFQQRYAQRTMRILLEGHSTTLEEIELRDCRDIDHSNIMGIFSVCKNLRKVVIIPNMYGNAILSFQDMVLQEWVCHDLKELNLTITRPRVARGEEEEDVMAKQAYEQIGRLSKLETLCLGCVRRQDPDASVRESEYDLTLERGWLAGLAGLKEMRYFYMATDFWSRMGQAEVEFMDANWPKLEKITFGRYGSRGDFDKPHWDWLQEKRPHLQYC